MKLNRVLLLFYSLFAINCQSQNDKSVITLTAKEFSEKLKIAKKVQLLDVRTPEEFNVDKIDKSININILDADFESKTKTLDKLKPVFVYCKAGSRSSKAASKLADLGFTIIYNLEGGIMKWNASGLSAPAKKPEGISEQNYYNIINKSNNVLINFYTKCCEPCKKIEPYILKFQDELKGKVTVVRLDADQNKTIIDSLKLDGLPVIIIYKNQKEVFRHIGFLSENELRKQLNL